MSVNGKRALCSGILLTLSCMPTSMAFPSSTDGQNSSKNRSISLREALGDWSFSSDTYRMDFCQMTGNLTIFPDRENSERGDCNLTAVEVCGGERSIVEQSCSVDLSDHGLRITSEIANYIEKKPSSIGYVPDNFELIDVEQDEMNGNLISAVTTRVVFRRSTGGIS